MIEGMAKKLLESPEGQKMIMDYLLSDKGKNAISQMVGDPKGRSSVVALITHVVDVLNLPADQKQLIKSALNALA